MNFFILFLLIPLILFLPFMDGVSDTTLVFLNYVYLVSLVSGRVPCVSYFGSIGLKVRILVRMKNPIV